MSNPYDRIRPDIRMALDDYARDGVPTGDFLRAVLSHDLLDAVCLADDYNLATLRDICRYVYTEIPAICHGSPKVYQQWIKHKALAKELTT